MLLNINPVPATPGGVAQAVMADYAQVRSAEINFANNTASAYVALGTLNDAGEFVNLQGGSYATVSMTPEQYVKWGTDDDYAVDCFIANLGLEKA